MRDGGVNTVVEIRFTHFTVGVALAWWGISSLAVGPDRRSCCGEGIVMALRSSRINQIYTVIAIIAIEMWSCATSVQGHAPDFVQNPAIARRAEILRAPYQHAASGQNPRAAPTGVAGVRLEKLGQLQKKLRCRACG